MVDYREYFVKGKFSKILELTRTLQTEEQKYWQFIAAINLDKSEIVEQLRNSFGINYENIHNKEYQSNIISLYEQYSTMTPFSKTKDFHFVNSSYGEKPNDLKTQLFNLFPTIFSQQNHQHFSIRKDKGIVNTNDYIIKFTFNPSKKAQLQREVDLLNSIKNELSIDVPNPEEFNSNSVVAGFYYRKLDGNSPYLKHIDTKQLIQLLTELQKLSEIPRIRKLLIPFKPEIDEFSTSLSTRRLLERQMGFSDSELQEIQLFIQLCKDHLSSKPEQMTFVHGDLYVNNLLATEENKITGIIDFERCWFADPLIDLSKLALQEFILDDLLPQYSVEITSLDIEYTKGIILLYRGVFILRRLLTEWNREVRMKMLSWVISPVDYIQSCLEG